MRFTIALTLLLAATPAFADEPLTVGTAGDYPPLTSYDADTTTFAGRAIDMVDAFAAAEGYTVTFVPTTWPTLMDDLIAGKFQMAAGGISRTPQRAEQALVSDPVGVTGKVALVRCGEEGTHATLAAIDTPDTRVVTNRGGTNEQFALNEIDAAVVIIVPNNTLPFTYLLEDRADVMFTDAIEAVYKQDQGEGLCAVHPDRPYTHDDKVFLFRKDEAALRDTFNAWLARNKKGESED
ncbi:transporter substrate-binding domain-containing protein [Bauldia sp.]|uniref:transporter substrate-binding domain-containing protein n=1 Tax=Bauldia sp. TaxID=2575872 RepID=UPI003BAC0FD2